MWERLWFLFKHFPFINFHILPRRSEWSIGWPRFLASPFYLFFPNRWNQGSLLVTSSTLKLKSKPTDDQFPHHLVSQRGVHVSKFGVVSPSSVGIGSTSIGPYLSNHIYELPAYIEGLSRGYIPFPVPFLVLIRDDTLGKACQMAPLAKCKNRLLSSL